MKDLQKEFCTMCYVVCPSTFKQSYLCFFRVCYRFGHHLILQPGTVAEQAVSAL